MGLEKNKALARRYWELINERQNADCLDLCSEEFRFWFPGTGPGGGYQPKEQARGTFESIFKLFPGGLIFTVHAVTAEGERVALEMESHGVHVNGRKYNNHYHFLFIVRGGKIAEIREYADTQHSREVLGDGPPGSAGA